jgi:predicted metalloprotease with PDZ domain
MPSRVLRWSLAVCAATVLGAYSGEAPAGAQTPAARISMSVDVDASHVTRGLLHVHERIPVAPGVLTLAYPKWIPGEHAPAGPLVNVAGLTIAAGSLRLRWERDLVDLYTIRVDVPPGTSVLDVQFDFLGAAVGRYSSARLASSNILVLTWNKVLLTPAVADYRTLTIAASVTLPGADWQYATALDVASHTGSAVTFVPVSMETLVDSPLDAGTNVRKWPLGTIDGAPVDLAVFADSPEQLDGDALIPKFRTLVAQMGTLYRARHFNHYTFLLTVSDVLPSEGVEHHQSSDDGAAGNFLIDKDALAVAADLLPHEFNHSWDGKYRRPAGLATPNLEVPMTDDLLWVYEGMTQFYGDLESERSGLRTQQQWHDHLATIYARLDSTTGRATNPLADTAAAAPVLYFAPSQYAAERRGTDFYDEGELMWLDADTTIRRLSHGRRSIDDFARAFFGRASTGPEVVTYTRDDVIAALNAVQAYDWRSFFATYVDAITAHPPDPFTANGWRVAYASAPSAFEKTSNSVRKTFDARYSLGIAGGRSDVVADVIDGSPAQRAGVAPGDKIVAIDGRAVGGDESESLHAQLDAALVRAEHGGPAMHVLLLGGGTYRDVAIPYDGGPRYPVLERIAGTADGLDVIGAPLLR